MALSSTHTEIVDRRLWLVVSDVYCILTNTCNAKGNGCLLHVDSSSIFRYGFSPRGDSSCDAEPPASVIWLNDNDWAPFIQYSCILIIRRSIKAQKAQSASNCCCLSPSFLSLEVSWLSLTAEETCTLLMCAINLLCPWADNQQKTDRTDSGGSECVCR